MTNLARGFGLSLLAAGLLLVAGVASAQIKINEIRIDHTGTDTDEYFELIGPPGTSLDGLSYLVIGDAGSGLSCGTVESVVDLTGFSLQADGLLCLRNSNAVPTLIGYDGSVPLTFENSDNVTHMLVSGFTGLLGDDLDPTEDGVFDVTPWTSVVDHLGLDEGTIPNCTTEEYLYLTARIGPDGLFVPGHAYRYSDTQTWAIGVFALGTTDTPGGPNPSLAQPVPIYVDMTRDPCVPLTGQPATVVAAVKNDPVSAVLRYRVDGGTETSLDMDVYGSAGDTVWFFTQIPAQAANGARVEYYCDAWNANPNPTRSYDQGYFVGTMNVADLRVNDADGNNVFRFYGARVRGHVTSAYEVFSGVNTDFNLQDATGGINVFKYDPHLVQPGLGDDVTVAGSLEQYNGRLELSAAGSCDTVLITIHGPGTPPAPLSLSLCDLRDEHEGLLVRVQNLFINTYEHTQFAGDWNYNTANCFDDSLAMFVDADTDIPGNPITSPHMEVVGIAGQYDTSPPYTWRYQVQPRSLADLTFLSLTSAPAEETADGVRLWAGAPNPFGRTTEIRYQVPAGRAGAGALRVRLALFDLSGRRLATLVDGPVPPGLHTAVIDRDALAAHGSGIVFCRLEVAGAVLTRTLVMLRQ